ncbi:MAG: 1-deoxy-D-xylulose-5-phosphate reductoisomerase [Bacteroidetes bacterium]|nr:1-deoxy-D-xylulose-5-phosphate reductoisomerase [Bacteroidota bacterium]MBU1718652.1 1-deoxy-D-xylulose-5-phosphate reductoisomerase [Bacteroidota bacterium]
MEENTKRAVAILGSTGSIGKQALEVIREHSDILCVEVLTAGKNADLLIQQALEFKPNMVVISDDTQYQKVKDALFDEDIKVFAGEQSIADVAETESIDIVLTAMVGYSGLKPTISAIKAGKQIALANKETFVIAGHLITQLIETHKTPILPVDSEHSAIFQCLAGEYGNPIEKIFLTASGGPFRGKTSEFLKTVSPQLALIHPNWNMGAKVTIDSATLMNKGLEVIEAHWLFGLSEKQIEVLVHPQSIIHSMVQFADGSIKAQLGPPDMRLPIQYALCYPFRPESKWPRCDFNIISSFSFEKPDTNTFPCLGLAYEAMKRGGNIPCAMNAANEIAVDAFLHEKISFCDIPDLIAFTMNQISYIANPTLDELIATNEESRRIAENR